MQWIERIDRADGRLVPVYIDNDGHRTRGSLCSSKNLLPPRGYKTAHVEGASLSSMKLTDAQEYLDEMGFAHADHSGHQIYVLPLNGTRVLIPAAVLLWAFMGQISVVGDRLLEAASLDRFAIPVIVSGGMRINFHRKAKLTQPASQVSVQARFMWMTCYASARRMWNSVYVNAMEGRLGLLLADATFNASLTGHRTTKTAFITRMVLRSLTPAEQPLAFAAPYVSGPLSFERPAPAADQLAIFRATLLATGALHPCCKQQPDITRGTAGWAMSANEWQLVVDEMKRAGFRTPGSVKRNIDKALEKFATGMPWSSLGPGWRMATDAYRRWVKSGQWEILKGLLAELRTTEAA